MITVTDLASLVTSLTEKHDLSGIVICAIPEEGDDAPTITKVRPNRANLMLGILLKTIATFIRESSANLEETVPLAVEFLINECYDQDTDVIHFDSVDDIKNIH